MIRAMYHVAVLVVLLILGCGPAESELEGEWHWEYAFGSHRQDTTRTYGEGHSLVLGDGSFKALDNDEVVTQGTYSLEGQATSARGEAGEMLRLSEEVPLLLEADWVVRVSGDTLRMMSVVDDDFDHIFVRRR